MAEYPASGMNTLENALKMFGTESLIEELDVSLEHVRRNKCSEAQHLNLLKAVDRNLLKQSLVHHPDKTAQKSQDRQVVLNATRTVLRALTTAFLADVDTHFRYEFFAQLDVSSLVNEREMDRQINGVLCKISFLSEVRRVNIVGEIRKFLGESRKCLESFRNDREDAFERHRDFALLYLGKCIEGYAVLVTECELVVNECGGQDERARSAIMKICEQSQTELSILRDLVKVAAKSLEGRLQIFVTYKTANEYDHFFVSPFLLYTNLMLMCTFVTHRNLGPLDKFKIYRKNIGSSNTDRSPQFNNYHDTDLWFKAYHLASYFGDKKLHEKEVEGILRKKDLEATSQNIVKEFKDALKSIEKKLEDEFDINSYKEGKSNREQFVEKLSKLNDSMMAYKEVEKELQVKLDLCKKETDEIRKEYSEFSERIQENEEQCRENILKCQNTSEEFARLKSGCYQRESTGMRFSPRRNVNGNVGRDEIKETVEMKLVKRLEKYEEMAGSLSDFLAGCGLNAVPKCAGHPSSFRDRNEYSMVIEGEVAKKIEASYELSKKINEQLRCLMAQTSSSVTEDFTGERREEVRSLKKSRYSHANDHIRESSGSSQNDSQNQNLRDDIMSGEEANEDGKYMDENSETPIFPTVS